MYVSLFIRPCLLFPFPSKCDFRYPWKPGHGGWPRRGTKRAPGTGNIAHPGEEARGTGPARVGAPGAPDQEARASPSSFTSCGRPAEPGRAAFPDTRAAPPAVGSGPRSAGAEAGAHSASAQESPASAGPGRPPPPQCCAQRRARRAGAGSGPAAAQRPQVGWGSRRGAAGGALARAWAARPLSARRPAAPPRAARRGSADAKEWGRLWVPGARGCGAAALPGRRDGASEAPCRVV